MKNSDLWIQYSGFTKDLSDNIRKLAFASVAISWLFKSQENDFPYIILYSIGAIVIFFFFDILQYLSGALVIKFWTEYKEKEFQNNTGTIEGDYLKPKWLDYPPFFCWVLKCIALLMSYWFLGKYIFLK